MVNIALFIAVIGSNIVLVMILNQLHEIKRELKIRNDLNSSS